MSKYKKGDKIRLLFKTEWSKDFSDFCIVKDAAHDCTVKCNSLGCSCRHQREFTSWKNYLVSSNNGENTVHLVAEWVDNENNFKPMQLNRCNCLICFKDHTQLCKSLHGLPA